MPLLEPDGDIDGDFRPRAGSVGLRSLMKPKASRQRWKSGDEGRLTSQGQLNKEKDTTPSKVKNFFESFRPRSKSDVSGMKKPGKKPPVNNNVPHSAAIKMDRSMDESQLRAAQHDQLSPQRTQATPMGQILEVQLASDASKSKALLSPTNTPVEQFKNMFRTRSNSDSRTKYKKPLHMQVR